MAPAATTPVARPVVTSAVVRDEDIGNRSFQLNEMEDSEQAVSALYLRAADHGVEFGATDGPVPDSVTGEWVLNQEDGTLGLSLTRKYEGDFSFSVTRFYKVRRWGGAMGGAGAGGAAAAIPLLPRASRLGARSSGAALIACWCWCGGPLGEAGGGPDRLS